MRILHLPKNAASQTSVIVRALRDIGIDAKGIVINNHPIQAKENIMNFEILSMRRHPIRWFGQTLLGWRAVRSALHWADVIHWHFDATILPKGLDLRYISLLNKPRIVQFWGSDIRIPEIASADNPYSARMYMLAKDNYLLGSRKRSIGAQSMFARYGFACIIPSPELLPYVQQDLFPSVFRTEAGLVLSEFEPKYPDAEQRKPVVVHMPSKPMVKGTQSVLDAIERLKIRYDFEFKLIHNVGHSEALAIVQNCDILLDQFVTGTIGLASLEAMALGKPVLCYIKPSLVEKFPSDFPIVNANQDNLVEVLEALLENGQRRNRIGRLSRAYVEEYHDAHKLALQLKGIYKKLLYKH